MREIVNVFRRLKSDEDGAALLEYTVLLAVLLVAVIAVIVGVGQWINTKWVALSNALP